MKAVAPTAFRILAYGPDDILEQPLTDVAALNDILRRFPVVWIDGAGLGDPERIKALGHALGLHPLAVADTLHTVQRPKFEQYDAYDYFVVRMSNRTDAVEMEQLSLFLGGRFVLTIQEHPGDCFDGVRERIRAKQGRIRGMGPDYLAYSIIDAAIDFYFPTLENYGEALDRLESDVLRGTDTRMPARLHGLKRDLLKCRRGLWPLRDALNACLRDPSARITADAKVYFRDCYDHVTQLLDLLEPYRELAADLLDIHLSVLNTHMNEIMKVLAIISTIFMPMTFVASIYGMNFKHMPELDWRYGYPFALGLMAVLALCMLIYFKKKKWF